MEDVTSFEVIIDISDCDKLYDYGLGKYYTRPSGGDWDMSVFKNRQCQTDVSHGDENKMVFVNQLDKMLTHSRCMEKKKEDNKEEDKQEALLPWNNYEFMHADQALPKRVLPIYQAGAIIKGHCLLEVAKPLNAQSLEISCQGQARTLIYIYNQYGGSRVTEKEEYINECRIAWEKSDDKKDDLSDKFALLGTSADGPLRSATLPAGKHRFEFEFKLPAECPGSTPQLIPTNWIDYAVILYRIKARIDSGSKLRRDLVSYKGLWVNQVMDIASRTDEMVPFVIDESLDSGIAFWKSGRVCCTLKLPRKAYTRGEQIPVRLEIENNTDTEISSVIAQVILRGKSRTGTNRLSCRRSIELKGKKIKNPGISAKQSNVLEFKVPLDFSEACIDNNLIPAGTLNDCVLIDVKYDLEVKAKRPGMHRNIEMIVPITVGTMNSKAEDTGLYPAL